MFVVGWVYFVFNIALDCSTLSLGNSCTHFCNTDTAKPVSIFFLYISPSGTFTLTRNESLASQSFLATCSFEKWHNSHFREGLVSADVLLNCQIAGAMAHASSAHTSTGLPDSPWQLLCCFSELCSRVLAEKPHNSWCSTPREERGDSSCPTSIICPTKQGQLVLSVFVASSVSFYPNCSSFSWTDSVALYRKRKRACLLWMLCNALSRNKLRTKTETDKKKHTQAEPTFNCPSMANSMRANYIKEPVCMCWTGEMWVVFKAGPDLDGWESL